MSPRDLQRKFRAVFNRHHGLVYSSGPLDVVPGDTIGIVLLAIGAPEKKEDVSAFLFGRYMDPARHRWRIPAGSFFRPVISRFRAARESARLHNRFRQIGGGAALNLLTREQAASLRTAVARRIDEKDVSIRSYVAARYGNPTMIRTMQEMQRDGVTKVVLVPLYPHFSSATTTSSVAYWHFSHSSGHFPEWPTVRICDFAGTDGYVQAVNDRINQALQRFPKGLRGDVHYLFVARGDKKSRLLKEGDPYCCRLHESMACAMKSRSRSATCSLAFLKGGSDRRWLGPALRAHLAKLADLGHKNILVVPLDYVSDQFDTAHDLDIIMRTEALGLGIQHYHVMSGVNCHPSFISGLANIVLERLGIVECQSDNTVYSCADFSNVCPGPEMTMDLTRGVNRCQQCPHKPQKAAVSARRRAPSIMSASAKSGVSV